MTYPHSVCGSGLGIFTDISENSETLLVLVSDVLVHEVDPGPSAVLGCRCI